MRSALTVALLAVASTAIADPVLCVPPRARAFSECAKGASLGEGDVARCQAREAARTHPPPRLRLDGGPWVTFAPRAWRCVPVPAAKVRIAIANFGRVFGSWTFDASAACPSQVFDVVGPNFYGAMYTKCARRPHANATIAAP